MMEKFFNKSFTEPRFKKEQLSTCKVFQLKTSLCVIGLSGCDSLKIYPGKVMGEVYSPAWFQNRAAGEITQVAQYTTLCFEQGRVQPALKITALTCYYAFSQWSFHCVYGAASRISSSLSLFRYLLTMKKVHISCSTLSVLLLFKRKSSSHIQNDVISMVNFLRWELALLAVSSHDWL